MLLRKDSRGVIAIGQASHAWLSGQLARAWGNERFGELEPYEEVCLAAEQHDLGMAAWDLEPELNPQTGLPRSFMEMALEVHLELWLAGPRRLVSQSRYGALLSSIHGSRLYQRRNLDTLPAAEAEAIKRFLDQQQAFQDRLIASLRADPIAAPTATERLIARNSQLLWIWDYLSLAMCLDWAPDSAREVPVADGVVDVALAPRAEPGRLSLDPWPFAVPEVKVHCEGRRLEGRFASEAELHVALAQAPWETVEFQLTPA